MFTHYLMIDWSAASVPRLGSDSIWIAEVAAGQSGASTFNLPTRHAAFNWLYKRLCDGVEKGERVLVGWDFVQGYPHGTADLFKLGGSGPAWLRMGKALCAMLEDDERNANNRFEVAGSLNLQSGGDGGPFWGLPHKRIVDGVQRRRGVFPHAFPGPHTSAGGNVEEYRLVERRLRMRKHWVHAAWKLNGAGSVGGQGLTGIPRVHRLRFAPELAGASLVWPFETDFERAIPPEGALVVHAEIWPGLTEMPPGYLFRDEAQVVAVSRRLAEADAAGELMALLAFPPELSPEERRTCLEEEGWIVGG